MESYQKGVFFLLKKILLLSKMHVMFFLFYFKVVKIIKLKNSACYLIMPLFDKLKTLTKITKKILHTGDMA